MLRVNTRARLLHRMAAKLLPPRLTLARTLATDSFLQGNNANYVDEMYNAWRQDPSSVHVSWNAYFKNIETTGSASLAFQAPPTIVSTLALLRRLTLLLT